MSITKRIVSFLASLAFMIAATIALAGIARADNAPVVSASPDATVEITSVNGHDIQGTVTCSTLNVVGIHIDTDGGPDGWADRKSTSDPRVNTFSYDTKGHSWFASVGCGGTPQNWQYNIKTKTVSRHGTVTISCSDIPGRQVCIVG